MTPNYLEIFINSFFEELDKFKEKLISLYPEKKENIEKMIDEIKNVVLNEKIENIDSYIKILKIFESVYNNFSEIVPDFYDLFNQFLENFLKNFLNKIR
jgi:polyhydroxyalkanoate synthesis regulator protein